MKHLVAALALLVCAPVFANQLDLKAGDVKDVARLADNPLMRGIARISGREDDAIEIARLAGNRGAVERFVSPHRDIESIAVPPKRLAASIAGVPMFAATDLGTIDVNPKCPENPCKSYRFVPFCKDTTPRDSICDGYGFKTWTQNSAITSVPAASVAGDNALADPDINPVYSACTLNTVTQVCSAGFSGAATGLAINATTGAITGTPTVEGAVTLQVTAANDLGSRVDVLSATVNEATPVAGVVYHVDCAAGSDAADGLSHANRWRTVGKVNSTVTATGADVYFLEDVVCTDATLTVDWGGTAQDRAIIGSYHSGPVYTLATAGNLLTPGSESPGSRAIIEGSYTPACRPSACLYNIAGARPSSSSSALVNIASAFVTVQDLEVRYSAAYGILIDSPQPNNMLNPLSRHAIIQRNAVHHNAEPGITSLDSADSIIRENEVSWTGLSYADNLRTNWGHSIGMHRAVNGHNLIENNWVHDVWGEHIGCNGTTHCIIRGNKTADGRRVHIYVNGSRDVVVEQNITAGGTVDTEGGLCHPARCGVAATPAFWTLAATHEEQTSPHAPGSGVRILFRNNLSANAETCHVWGSTPDNLGLYLIGGKHIGNTCVTAAGKQWPRVSPTNIGFYDHIEIANNLYAGATTSNSLAPSFPTVVSFHHNGQTTLFSDVDARGTGDVVSTVTGLGAFNFATASQTNFPAYTDFQLVSTSDFDEVGQAMTANYMVAAEYPQQADFTWQPACSGGHLSSTNWIKALYADYCNAQRTTNDIGAFND